MQFVMPMMECFLGGQQRVWVTHNARSVRVNGTNSLGIERRVLEGISVIGKMLPYFPRSVLCELPNWNRPIIAEIINIGSQQYKTHTYVQSTAPANLFSSSGSAYIIGQSYESNHETHDKLLIRLDLSECSRQVLHARRSSYVDGVSGREGAVDLATFRLADSSEEIGNRRDGRLVMGRMD
jgi:hypothetical protein